MNNEIIQDIINKNFKEFLGSNEAILHASEDIAELIEAKDKELLTYRSLVDDATKEIDEKDEEIFYLKDNDPARVLSFLKTIQERNAEIYVKDKEIAELKAEIERLKEFEFMYNSLKK